MEAKRIAPRLYAVTLDDDAVVWLVVATSATTAIRRAAARQWMHTRSPMPTKCHVHVRELDN